MTGVLHPIFNSSVAPLVSVVSAAGAADAALPAVIHGQKIGCFHQWGIPKMHPNAWFITANPIQMDDLREPPFQETFIYLQHQNLTQVSGFFLIRSSDQWPFRQNERSILPLPLSPFAAPRACPASSKCRGLSLAVFMSRRINLVQRQVTPLHRSLLLGMLIMP